MVDNMCVLPAVWYIISLLLSADYVLSQRYIVPEATLELLSPRGLKISIPDIDDEVNLVAFHININEEFYGLEHGHFAQDIIKKRDGRWVYYIPEFKVKQGDTIYYWIYVIVDKLGYHGLDRVFKVTQVNPHGPSSSTPSRPPTSASTPSPLPTSPPSRPTNPPSTSVDRDSCHVSLTSRNGGLSACTGHVIFQKRFNDLSDWSHEVYIGGDEADDEFTVFTTDPATSKVENGNLVIKPILLEEKYDENFVQSGTLNLNGCTSSNLRQCSKTAQFYLILPPVMSSRLTTENSFSFRYGIVEIRAKLPQGDWIVPELWLLPKTPSYGDCSGQIVMGLSRGNVDFASADSNWLLEAGAIVNNSRKLVRKTGDKKWSQDFHNFKLMWTQDEMVFYVDNEEISRLPSGGAAIEPSLNAGKLAPFDKEFYLSLGVHVGGCRDFPDSIQNKPWKNTNVKRLVQFWEAKGSWHPTWNSDSSLRVDSIKVTAI